MFKKYGDGKIVSVLEEEELSEEQKKIAKEALKQRVKQAEENSTKDS